LVPYIEREQARGTPLHAVTRHLLGLFHAVPGALVEALAIVVAEPVSKAAA
jgi:hypothetical protein